MAMKARRRLPPPNWLRAFEAAARHLSFTGAARELKVTQSAVSQQVKLLEHYLGEPLFHRYSRRLELTDRGEAYLPTVRRAFERLAAATEELFGHKGGRLLTVRVSAAFAVLWLAPRLGRFRAANPGLDLRLNVFIWSLEFDWEGVDLEIRYGDGRWPGFNAVRLTHDQMTPVCAPALRDALATPDDLGSHTLLHVIGHQDGWRCWLRAIGADHVDAAQGLEFDSSMMAFELAAAGTGVALGRTSLVEGYLASERLVAPFDVSIPDDEAFYLIWPENRAEHAAATAFRKWLMEETRDAREAA